MSYQATVYRVLVASPKDVVPERAAIPEVIAAWNATHAADTGVVLMPVLWENDAVPEMGERPQAIINRQLVQDCDILVGAFWTRLGTPTSVAESGTVEEIEEFNRAGKPVMLYFSSVPVIPESIDADQYRRLTEFRSRVEGQGLTDRYSSVPELREKLLRHLTDTVRRIHVPLPDQRSLGTLAENSPAVEGRELEAIHQQLSSSILRRERDWVTERDSQPMRLDNAKSLLRALASEMLDFRTLLEGKVESERLLVLEDAVRQAKVLQSHKVYTADGGVSSREFWSKGDRVFGILVEFLTHFPARSGQEQHEGARTKLAATASVARRQVDALLDLQSAGQADPDWMKAVLDRGPEIESSLKQVVHLAADAGLGAATHATAALKAFIDGLDRIEDVWGSRSEARKRYKQPPAQLCEEAAAQFERSAAELKECGSTGALVGRGSSRAKKSSGVRHRPRKR